MVGEPGGCIGVRDQGRQGMWVGTELVLERKHFEEAGYQGRVLRERVGGKRTCGRVSGRGWE